MSSAADAQRQQRNRARLQERHPHGVAGLVPLQLRGDVQHLRQEVPHPVQELQDQEQRRHERGQQRELVDHVGERPEVVLLHGGRRQEETHAERQVQEPDDAHLGSATLDHAGEGQIAGQDGAEGQPVQKQPGRRAHQTHPGRDQPELREEGPEEARHEAQHPRLALVHHADRRRTVAVRLQQTRAAAGQVLAHLRRQQEHPGQVRDVAQEAEGEVRRQHKGPAAAEEQPRGQHDALGRAEEAGGPGEGAVAVPQEEVHREDADLPRDVRPDGAHRRGRREGAAGFRGEGGQPEPRGEAGRRGAGRHRRPRDAEAEGGAGGAQEGPGGDRGQVEGGGGREGGAEGGVSQERGENLGDPGRRQERRGRCR